MQTRPLLSASRQRGIGDWLVIIFSVLLVLLGAAIFGLGIWLTALGGSWYYVFAGAGLVVVGGLMLVSPMGVWLYLAILAVTWIWAFWEAGGDGWALVPRVVAPSVLRILALLCLLVLWRDVAPDGRRRIVASSAIFVISLFASLVGMRDSPLAQEQAAVDMPAAATTMAAKAPAPRVAADNPSASKDWPTYGGSNHALRYSSLAQINASNVKQLKRVWTFRTGDLPNEKTKDKYSPETTPIKVGDSLFVCSAKNVLISLHAATGHEQWRYDPKVPDDAFHMAPHVVA